MNAAINTFRADDSAFITKPPTMAIVADDTDDTGDDVDPNDVDDDVFGVTDLEILEAIVAAATR